MKYYIRQIKEDNELLSGYSLNQLKKLTGMDRAYLSRIRAGKFIVSEKMYRKLKKLILPQGVDN